MADELRVLEWPALTRPVLVAAFRGWNDGGQGASLAGGYLAKGWNAERFADIVVDVAERLGVEMMVSLGALLADVPHTRPSPVTGSATDPALVERLALKVSRYEGPTGIVGVLHDACRREGLDSASLWAAVPHYVSLAPSPRAALALCERLSDLLGTRLEADELEQAVDAYSEQVTEAVAADPDTQAYVEQLEQRADELGPQFDVPSSDTIAAELTRYLREREEEGGGPDSPSAQ